MERLRVLSSELLNSTVTEEELLARGKVELAKVTLSRLQRKLEMLYFSITRRMKEISALADSSKRRSSMRAKCSREKTEIASTVEELNSVNSLLKLPATSAEAILAGDFLWSFSEEPATTKSLPVRYKAQVVEKFMLVQRLKEEEDQIRKEMKNFLVFYLKNILDNLHQRKAVINERIAFIHDVNEPDDKYQNENENLLGDRKCYSLRCERIETLQGQLAITNKGIAFAKSQIAVGLKYFRHLDTSLACLEEIDDKCDDDDDDEYYNESEEDWSSDDNNELE
ncbi:uncharacterized protein LOC114526580 isoform X2 [Dendronephthya gigantea]|uniref:uncharacterized protein LOC114526580 isoform X2 n=1 Tax=Dendronephthya gigantea TaxID=151771 RepID=UPI001068DF2E|nr:uncharacterized protein LOC114526580 isoform X2 [Dendronephthya gigantea]